MKKTFISCLAFAIYHCVLSGVFCRRLRWLVAGLVLLSGSVVHAGLITETDDAGELLITAQFLPVGTSSVMGRVSGDSDLFGFEWGGGDFSAVVTDYFNLPLLFLFDATGHGLLSGFGDIGISTFLAPSTYFIGISVFNLPVSSEGLIWFGPGSPDGPGAAAPLSGWSSTGGGTHYLMEITPIPSPSTLLLLAIAAMFLLRFLKMRVIRVPYN